MPTKQPVRYWNREKNRQEEERIYGEGALRWLYQTRPGRWLAGSVFSSTWVSWLVGRYQSSRLSRWRIRSFIEEFEIPMEDFEATRYASFNDFFCRRFKPGARSFCASPEDLPAFAEGRYLAYEKAEPERACDVKGENLTPAKLLGSEDRAEPFLGGGLIIVRLCPIDYHRFHFPDAGSVSEAYRIPGRLHSVNPLALRLKSDILVSNERRVSILETENFGRLAYVEVGAMNVGKIVQTHPRERLFRRGEEKGYFLFGASSIVLVGEPGRWKPADDLLERTAGEQESLVRLGEPIARSA